MDKTKIEYEFLQIESELEILRMLKIINDQNGLDKIQIRAAASSLHSIYNGIEKILFYKLKEKNIMMSKSTQWHKEILDTAEAKNIISTEQKEELIKYMGFRHFFRHNYGFMVDPELIRPLLNNVDNIIKVLKNTFRLSI